ncbi:MAG: IF-2-associated domain-containing protein, partial [Pseudomonadota bacterium]
LLKYLKRSHGEPTEAPKRITLKRKTLSTLRTSGSQGKKTVNVEVRKKRTYVKREVEQPVAEEEVELEAVAEVAEPEAAEVAAVEPEPTAEVEQEFEPEPEPEPEPEVDEDPANLDPEVLRQRRLNLFCALV